MAKIFHLKILFFSKCSMYPFSLENISEKYIFNVLGRIFAHHQVSSKMIEHYSARFINFSYHTNREEH
jgi:hypothetical protein